MKFSSSQKPEGQAAFRTLREIDHLVPCFKTSIVDINNYISLHGIHVVVRSSPTKR